MTLARHCALMLCACGWGAPALHEPCPAVMSSRASIASIPTGRAAAGAPRGGSAGTGRRWGVVVLQHNSASRGNVR